MSMEAEKPIDPREVERPFSVELEMPNHASWFLLDGALAIRHSMKQYEDGWINVTFTFMADDRWQIARKSILEKGDLKTREGNKRVSNLSLHFNKGAVAYIGPGYEFRLVASNYQTGYSLVRISSVNPIRLTAKENIQQVRAKIAKNLK